MGQGLAHGAAMGNLFASPSAQQIYNVAKAANNGGGVLLGYGNYAGDVLHFNQAQARLRAEGIDCRSIAVTDDVSSAPPAEHAKRRGIAGDLTVFKVAAAAAEAGYTLDEAVEIAERANDRTRSFGVAFSGCTLPGRGPPALLRARGPDGRRHRHPRRARHRRNRHPDGRRTGRTARRQTPRRSSRRPEADGDSSTPRRVVPILNGLGSVKYEELFVVYRRVARLLAEAGSKPSTRRSANSSPASTWPAPP